MTIDAAQGLKMELPPVRFCVSDIHPRSQPSRFRGIRSARRRCSNEQNYDSSLAPNDWVKGYWIRLVLAGTEYLNLLDDVNQAVFWGWKKQPPPPKELLERAEQLYAIVPESVDVTVRVELDERAGRIQVRRNGVYVTAEDFAENRDMWMDFGFYRPGYHSTLKIVSLDNGASAELPVNRERQPLKSVPVHLDGRQSLEADFRLSQGRYQLRLSANLLSDTAFAEEAFIRILVTDVDGEQTEIVERQSENIENRGVSFVVGNDCPVRPGLATVHIDTDITYGHWQIRDFQHVGKEGIFERIWRKWTLRRTWKLLRVVVPLVGLITGIGTMFDWIDWPFGGGSSSEDE